MTDNDIIKRQQAGIEHLRGVTKMIPQEGIAMDAENVIKAFELCFAKKGTILTCNKCPYHQYGKLCKVKRDKDALVLVYSLKAKNEALQMDKEQLESDIVNERMNLEHLLSDIQNFRKDVAEVKFRKKKIKSEAYKEFAKRLKEVYTLHEGLHIEIDNLVKELTEGSND